MTPKAASPSIRERSRGAQGNRRKVWTSGICGRWDDKRKTAANPFARPLGSLAAAAAFRAKKWWPDPDSNWGHGDFQSPALPTELSCHALHNIAPIFDYASPFFAKFTPFLRRGGGLRSASPPRRNGHSASSRFRSSLTAQILPGSAKSPVTAEKLRHSEDETMT